jgi:hypothetical protein
MHIDAKTLQDEGKSRDEIAAALAQRYEHRRSYTQRILEDAVREYSS